MSQSQQMLTLSAVMRNYRTNFKNDGRGKQHLCAFLVNKNSSCVLRKRNKLLQS